MKKSFFVIFSVFLLLILTCFNIKISNAGIYFINKPTSMTRQEDSKPCQIRGYTKTAKTCAEIGKILKEICPQNSKLGRDCGCDNKFQYNASNCTQNKTLSGGSCDGKYEKCECNKSIYKYSSNDCKSPLTLDYNDYCVNPDNSRSYKTCSCASEYSQTCSGNFEGVGTACNGKFSSCKCKSNFMKCDNGGANGAQSCSDDQGTKYSSCKQLTCADGGYVSSIPTGQTCTSVSYNSLTCYKDCKSVNKYEISDDCKNIHHPQNGKTIKVCRITALKNFDVVKGIFVVNIKIGDRGGYIEKEKNLSQENLSWIADEAIVFDEAKVFDDAIVYDNAKIYGNSFVFNYAKVFGNAQVYENASMIGYVSENAQVYGNASIRAFGSVHGNAQVYGDADIWNEINGTARVCTETSDYYHGSAISSGNYGCN